MKPADLSSDLIETTAAQWVARRDAGLTPPEETDFSRWLETDERHAAAFARFEATWLAVSQPHRTGAGSALAGELAALRRRRRIRRLRMAGIAAAVLLAAGLLWNPGGSRDAAPAGSRVVLLTPEVQTLADGSVVELKPGAKIAVEFTAALRRVRLVQGEAYFSVMKNPARPFVVTAATGVEMRAVGTAFSVQRGESSVGLLVTEGRVSVNRSSDSDTVAAGASSPLPTQPAPLALVDAGQRLDVDSGVPLPASLPVNAVSTDELAERLAWRAPLAEFSGTPLGDVVTFINRHTRTRYVIDDAELARVPLSGMIPLEDGAAFVRMLETGFGIQAERREAGVIFLRKASH